jgi:argininosuccinate lyase
MPFRDAHAVVGGIVRDSLERGVPMAELVESHPQLGRDAVALLGAGVAVTRRQTAGGTGPAQVADQRKRFAAHINAEKTRLTSTLA